MKHFKNKLIALFSLLSLSCSILAAELGGEHSTLICPQSLNIPEKTFIESDLTDDDIYISADNAELIEEGVSSLSGNAEIRRKTQQIKANTINYDEPNDSASLDGDVNYWDKTLFLKSNKGSLKLDNGSGEFENAD